MGTENSNPELTTGSYSAEHSPSGAISVAFLAVNATEMPTADGVQRSTSTRPEAEAVAPGSGLLSEVRQARVVAAPSTEDGSGVAEGADNKEKPLGSREPTRGAFDGASV